MIIVLQVVGVVAVLVGLVTIGFGIPIRDFSFGNLLIVVGTIVLCTGMLLLGLSVVAIELQRVVRRLAASRPAPEPRARTALPGLPAGAPAPMAAGEPGPPPFAREQPSAQPPPLEPTVAPPWHDDGSRAKLDAPLDVDPAQDAAPAVPPQKPRRNLMFQSSVRRDRERDAAASADPAPPDVRAAPPPPPPAVPEPNEAPPASFEDAWPKPGPGRARPADIKPSELPPRRPSRLAPTPTPAPAPAEPPASAAPERPAAAPPVPPPPESAAPAVTVLKSGVVDGMAYSLYSDGSIEAQMPEGMMRFASIDELRAHLDQRP